MKAKLGAGAGPELIFAHPLLTTSLIILDSVQSLRVCPDNRVLPPPPGHREVVKIDH